jgi:threonine dehydratase
MRTVGQSKRLPLHPLRERAASHSRGGYPYTRDLERGAANRRDRRSGGRGSGAAGACIAAEAINPEIAVIGVQAEAAPAAYLSWRERRPVDAVAKTWAEGLATGTPFELPQRILQRLLDDFVLVSEEAITEAVTALLARTRLLVEGAGAAPLAGALALRDRLRGRRVALILTGGNISIAQLQEVLKER